MSSNRITIISALNMFIIGVVIESLIPSILRVSVMLFPDPSALPGGSGGGLNLFLSRYVW